MTNSRNGDCSSSRPATGSMAADRWVVYNTHQSFGRRQIRGLSGHYYPWSVGLGKNMQIAQVSLDVLTLSDGVNMLHTRHDCGVSLHPDSDIFRPALVDL